MKKHIPKAGVLRKEARVTLRGSWGKVALLTLVYFFLWSLLKAADHITGLASLVVGPAFMYGYTKIMLHTSRKEPWNMEMLFSGLSDRFGTYLLAYLVMLIRTILWSLLFIIPGIIAAIRYSQTFLILVDDKNIDAMEAIERSKEMMRGHKMNYFLLGLSFIGWEILSILSCFIGFLWLSPYMGVTYVKFYEELKKEEGHVAV